MPKVEKGIQDLLAQLELDLGSGPSSNILPRPTMFEVAPHENPDLPKLVTTETRPKQAPRGMRLSWEMVRHLAYVDDLVRLGMVSDVPNTLAGVRLPRRLEVAWTYTGNHLRGGVAREVRELFSAKNAAVMAGMFAAWAGGHYLGYSWVVDAILLGVAGYTGLNDLQEISAHLWSFYEIASKANSARELDKAGWHMAQVISRVGVDAVVGAFIGKGYRSLTSRKLASKLDSAGRVHLPWRDATPLVQPGRPIPLVDGGRVPKNWELSNVASKAGMTTEAVQHARRTAMGVGVTIDVRPSGLAGRGQRAGGHAKPEWMKMNSINELDVQLGANKADMGKIAIFRPKPVDPNLKRTDPQLYDRLMNRFDHRMKQLHDYGDEVVRMSSQGDVILLDGILHNAATGRPYVGDYDIFAISRNGRGHLSSSDWQYQRALTELFRRPFHAQHGPHVNWRPTTPKDVAIYNRIVDLHRTRQPVVRFAADGSIYLALHE